MTGEHPSGPRNSESIPVTTYLTYLYCLFCPILAEVNCEQWRHIGTEYAYNLFSHERLIFELRPEFLKYSKDLSLDC